MSKITYDRVKIKSIMKEIDAIDGFINYKKEEELKLKYPGFRSLHSLINSHNSKLNRNRKKSELNKNKNQSKLSNNNPIQKSITEFKIKLRRINRFIDETERSKLNPNKNPRYDKYIDFHNKRYIRNEQKEILKEFKNDLTHFNDFLGENEIEKFKTRYVKNYHNYFTSLNMQNSIDNFNKKMEEKQTEKMFVNLKNYSLNPPISKEDISDLISQNPNLDWNKIIKKYNGQYFKVTYNKTEDGVYYLNDYIRKSDWKYVSSKESQISDEILKYKDNVHKLINKFTDEIIEFIEILSNYELDDEIKKIFLVSIPSSTNERDLNSPIKKSIQIIENKYKTGLIKFNDGCEREIINFSKALVRIENVKTAHMSTVRPTYNDHIRTIKFNDYGYRFKNSIIIVLDDITTTGIIMNACENILIDNGIEKEIIYKLAIAATE